MEKEKAEQALIARRRAEFEAKKAEEARLKQEAEQRAKAEQARQLAEKKRQEEEARKAAEARRAQALAEKRRQEAEAKRAEAALRQAEANRIAKAEAERKRVEAAQRQAEERRRAEAAARQRQEQAQAQARQVAASQWGSQIEQHVKRHWNPPPGSRGQMAKIRLEISYSGFVKGRIQFIQCSEPGFCASIEDAFRRAEPLPAPSRNDLDRTLLITMD